MMMMNKKNILVLCTGNSCRSQMAEAYLRHFAGDRANVCSAGLETHGVNPRAIAAMAEDGIDIAAHTSDNLDRYRGTAFDYVITVCDNANERCPFFPTSATRFHRNFPDPAKASGSDEAIMQVFREVRRLIRDYCDAFVTDELLKSNEQ